jgi:hypothetical protein
MELQDNFCELGDKVVQYCLSDEETSNDSDDSGSPLDAAFLSWIQENADDLPFVPRLNRQPKMDIGTPVAAAAVSPEVPDADTASDEDSKASLCPDAEDVQQPRKGVQPKSADGKFPVSENGRCTHTESWSRLRGKRGHSYFFCEKCQLGWRQPTKERKLRQSGQLGASNSFVPLVEPLTIRVGNMHVYPQVFVGQAPPAAPNCSAPMLQAMPLPSFCPTKVMP